ncbi:Vgb family protein [Microvirga puerhi]|uniref:Virginiamycin B lyase n=1 Tax=Microvirga puerhi TaxID=2876078 RepID=A0ABS7VUL4_9HYPH|nr:lyase [Microvirga puerhi]MBZ6079259.1 lyase [Microvirga puerhi]
MPHARSLALALLAVVTLGTAGSAQEPQQVFPLPEGAYPHDVAPAPDGKVWYSAQRNGAIGILDPATGQSREIKLGPKSAPHGVIRGPDDAAWLTDGGQNAIVRFDPRTEQIRVWKLSEDTGYTNLNTAVFDPDGVLWFTGQNGFYGKLDPKSGAMKVWKAPRGRGTYGMTVTPAGDIYYASLAGNHIARIDRTTGEATVLEPPTKNQGARRVWSDSKGRIWVSEWNAGQLGLYDPQAKSWREWRLPGDKPQAYAVYVDERDMVWVSDWGANAVLSFDPVNEKFTSYPLSDADAGVRQILGRPGEVWLPESGSDRLMVIRTPRPSQ